MATGFLSLTTDYSSGSKCGRSVSKIFHVSARCQQVSTSVYKCLQVSASVSKCQQNFTSVSNFSQVSACVSEVSAKLDFVFAKNKTFRRTRMYLRRNRFVDVRMHAQKSIWRIIAGINIAKSILAKLQNITGHYGSSGNYELSGITEIRVAGTTGGKCRKGRTDSNSRNFQRLELSPERFWQKHSSDKSPNGFLGAHAPCRRNCFGDNIR